MCTERKATGEYVLACFMFATMSLILTKRKLLSLVYEPAHHLLRRNYAKMQIIIIKKMLILLFEKCMTKLI